MKHILLILTSVILISCGNNRNIDTQDLNKTEKIEYKEIETKPQHYKIDNGDSIINSILESKRNQPKKEFVQLRNIEINKTVNRVKKSRKVIYDKLSQEQINYINQNNYGNTFDTTFNSNGLLIKILDLGQYVFKGFYINNSTLIRFDYISHFYNYNDYTLTEYYFDAENSSLWFAWQLFEQCCVDGVHEKTISNYFIENNLIVSYSNKKEWTFDIETIKDFETDINKYIEDNKDDDYVDSLSANTYFIEQDAKDKLDYYQAKYILEYEDRIETLKNEGVYLGNFIKFSKNFNSIVLRTLDNELIYLAIDSLDSELKKLINVEIDHHKVYEFYWKVL